MTDPRDTRGRLDEAPHPGAEHDAWAEHEWDETSYDVLEEDPHPDGFVEDHDHPLAGMAGEPTSRRARREHARRRRQGRRRRVRGLVVLVLALAVVAGAGVVAVGKLRPLLDVATESQDYPGPGTGSVVVTVADGDTASAIGTKLQDADVVKTAKAFASAAADDPKGASIQPGAYTLKKQMSAAGALAVLVDPANRSVPQVTVREGLWLSETLALLSKQTGVPLADYQAAAKDPGALGLPAEAKGNLEGWLFPSTYEFSSSTSAVEQLTEMVAKTQAELTSLGVQPGQQEKTLVLASIVQAEGRRAADLPKIARVIDNRLAVPMKLQLDSTVSYGVQKRALTTTDAERAAKNGYNTYVRDGLPVGPIGNPGAEAITAAQNPAAGPWLYFVAVNPSTGETKFATTAAEHQANVEEFQKWCSQNPGKC